MRRLIASAATLFLCLGVNGSRAADCVLRVTTWGGNYQKTYESIAGEFEKENNCKVQWVVGATLDFTVKARMSQVDVVTNNQIYAAAGEAEGLWLKLDESKIPNIKNLYDVARVSPYTIWINVGDYALVYNSNKVSNPPTSWDDLWDPKYKNRVAMLYFSSPGTLGLAIMQAQKKGGGIDNIDPGLRRIADLVKSGNAIGMIDVESQLVSLFESNEAWLGMITTGRLKDLLDRGRSDIKIVRPPEGTFPTVTTMNIVKTTTNPDMAAKFVNFALGKTAQEAFARNNLYTPTNRTVPLPESPYASLYITPDHIQRLFPVDPIKTSQQQAAWRERFDRMVK